MLSLNLRSFLTIASPLLLSVYVASLTAYCRCYGYPGSTESGRVKKSERHAHFLFKTGSGILETTAH